MFSSLLRWCVLSKDTVHPPLLLLLLRIHFPSLRIWADTVTSVNHRLTVAEVNLGSLQEWTLIHQQLCFHLLKHSFLNSATML